MKKLLFLIICIMFMTSCLKKYNTINISIPSNPKTMNAQVANDSYSKFILLHIFEGLTKENINGQIIPGVAKSWTVNGNVWTFNISQEAKWQNGKNVTAMDFVSAWERAINPKSKNENAHYFYMIKGAYEYSKGLIGRFDSVGIKALNDSVLEVELAENVDYFDKIVAQTMFYPVNTEFYKSHKENYGKDKKNILGNGVYKISKYDQNKEIIIVKNEIRKLDDKNNLEKIDIKINSDAEKNFELYSENLLDVYDCNNDFVGNKINRKEINDFYTGEMRYIKFSNSKKIFSNTKIRKAIALAINKKEFISNFNLREVAAEVFIPTNMLEKDTLKNTSIIKFDVAKAKIYLEEGLRELNMNLNDFENVSLLVRANSEEIRFGSFIVNQINENLGLNIKLISKTSQMLEQKLGSGNYDITLSTFEPETLYDLQYFNFYFSVLNDWKKEDLKKKELLENTENILISEIPIVPLTFSKKSIIIKDKLEGVRISNISNELDFRFASIKKSK